VDGRGAGKGGRGGTEGWTLGRPGMGRENEGKFRPHSHF